MTERIELERFRETLSLHGFDVTRKLNVKFVYDAGYSRSQVVVGDLIETTEQSQQSGLDTNSKKGAVRYIEGVTIFYTTSGNNDSDKNMVCLSRSISLRNLATANGLRVKDYNCDPQKLVDSHKVRLARQLDLVEKLRID